MTRGTYRPLSLKAGRWSRAGLLIGTLALSMTSIACSGANDAAFCEQMGRLEGERPEAYVGSPQHLADVERTLSVAPSRIRQDVKVYRDFIASGAIDARNPDSNVFENWPPDVQAAVARTRQYASENC